MSSQKTAQRLSRILSMLPWVIAHDGASTDDVIERFGYRSKADLIKDLHLVFMTGLPGYGPGDLIDVDVSDDEVFVDAADYFSRPTKLTAPEALGLLAAGMTMINSEQAPPALSRAIEKLTAVVIPDSIDVVYLDVPTPDAVASLQDAVSEHRVVHIAYVSISTNEETTREVEGWSVFFTLGNWYLKGWCRRSEAERVFRVDRVASLDVLDETFSAPTIVDPTAIEYRPSDSDSHVSFTVDSSARWIAEYDPANVESLDNGTERVTLSVSDPLVAARLLIRVGGAARDVVGDEVLEAMASLITRITDRYSQK